jgi:hypothetical protein
MTDIADGGKVKFIVRLDANFSVNVYVYEVLNPDLSFEVSIDQLPVISGSLLDLR